MKKSIRVSLFVAGGIGLFFTVFHCLMFYLFKWSATLACLDPMNWATFQTFNLVAILMVATITFFSFRHPDELVKTALGKSLLIVFGIFYLIRIAAEFIFYGYRGTSSLVIIILCLVPAMVYLFSSVSPMQREETVHQL
ncbi:MAG: hypothetical protein HY868_08305 [Chloroflexi bacterium]|nr:hypothetical protein [Chloroflexota bacterium]